MGVQYQGASVAAPDARGSIRSSQEAKRHPDVILKPQNEGTNFSLQLLAANRMAKVVEWQLLSAGSGNTSKHDIAEEDIAAVFAAMGSDKEEDFDEEVKDEYAVTEDYQGPDEDYNIQAGGLPYLESLSIVREEGENNRNEETAAASFLVPLTAFLASSQSFPRFTSLTLKGVNLRGTPLALRALTEVIRLHPRLRRVQMTQCQFTKEQQDDVKGLQAAMATARPSIYASTASRQQEMVFHEPGEAPPEPSFMKQRHNATKKQTTYFDTAISTPILFHPAPKDEAPPENKDAWWGERLFKNCFCWW